MVLLPFLLCTVHSAAQVQSSSEPVAFGENYCSLGLQGFSKILTVFGHLKSNLG